MIQCCMIRAWARLGKKELPAWGVETERIREGVKRVGCEFVHRCIVMLTSKLGSMRRMYCSMGWYRGGQGMPLPPSIAMACSLAPPWYTTSPADSTYAWLKKLQMSVEACWTSTTAVQPSLTQCIHGERVIAQQRHWSLSNTLQLVLLLITH